jgi:cysteine desulfurase
VERAERLTRLRDALVDGITARIPDAVVSGDPGAGLVDGGPSRLPGNAHLRFPGCEGDSLLMLLDARGIECSTGSACTAGVARPSHVLLAMGVPEDEARGALRFSLGSTSTAADVQAVLDAIEPVVHRARNAAAAGARRRPTPSVP